MGCKSSSPAVDPIGALPQSQIVGAQGANAPQAEPVNQSGVKSMKIDVIWNKAKIILERDADSKYCWKLSAPFEAKSKCDLAVHFHCQEQVTKEGLSFLPPPDQGDEIAKLPKAFMQSYPVGEHVLELSGEKSIDLQSCPLEICWKYKRLGEGAETSVYPIVLSLRSNSEDGGSGIQSVLYAALTMDALNEAGAPMRLGQKDQVDSAQDGDKKYYCGRSLGADRLPGTDGVCGPRSGPQCDDCQKAQMKLQETNPGQQLRCMILLHQVFTRGKAYAVQEMYGLADMAKQAAAAGEETEGEDCVICLSEPRTTAVVPCRHLCVCEECALALRVRGAVCPICRGPVQNTACFRLSRTGSENGKEPGGFGAVSMPITEEEEQKKREALDPRPREVRSSAMQDALGGSVMF